MGNVTLEVNPDNPWIITINAEATTTEQRRLLGKTIDYSEDSEIPLLASIIMDSMQKKVRHMESIFDEETAETRADEKAEILGNFLSHG